MKYVLIVLFVFLAVLPARAEKIAIAVLDLDAKGEGLSQGVADALTETVRFEFAKQESIDLVAREKMKELAKEKAFQLTGCTDVACAVQIGKALNVQKMVMGTLTKMGEKYTIFLRMVDVEKENVECSEKIDAGSSVDSLDTYVSRIVYSLKRSNKIKRLRDIIQRNPNDTTAHYQLGRELCWQQETRAEAIQEFHTVVALKPYDIDANNSLALALWMENDYLGAENIYRMVLRLDPENPDVWLSHGEVLRDLERYKEAEKDYRKAIRLNSSYPGAHSELGYLLAKTGRYKEAEHELRESVRLMPTNHVVLCALAAFLEVRDRKIEAQKYIDKALEFVSQDQIEFNIAYSRARMKK